MGCGCFSAADTPSMPKTRGMNAKHQRSYPEPPEIFSEGQNQAEIYNRLRGVIQPVEAERDTATINKKSFKSRDLDAEDFQGASKHELLTQKSARFERTTSLRNDTQSTMSGAALSDGEQVWTHDRKVLEMAIQAEKLADQSGSDWNPDLQSEEQRLTKRLNNLALEMKIMEGDGNCQFRAISYGMYGSQDYHMSLRQKAVDHMKQHKSDYAGFLGEDIDTYLTEMGEDGTWGDELTLRAISDYWGIVINVVTSDKQGWFMRYKPKTVRILLELFLTYIAPVHYNAIRRQTMTSALKNTLQRQNTSAIEQAMAKALSAEKSLQGANFSAQVRAALRGGLKLEVPTTDTKGAPAPNSMAKAAALNNKNSKENFVPPMSPVKEESVTGASPKRRNLNQTSQNSAITEDGHLNGVPKEDPYLNGRENEYEQPVVPPSAFASPGQNRESFESNPSPKQEQFSSKGNIAQGVSRSLI